MAVWLHEIGHRGSYLYGEPFQIRALHGIISAELLCYEDIIGRGKTVPAMIYEDADPVKSPLVFADSVFSWTIEEYHRRLRRFCGVERCQCGSAKTQRNHIGLSIRTFLRFEIFSLKTGYSRFETENRIIRDAVRVYLTNPVYAF